MTDAPKPGLIFAIQYNPRGTANHLTSPYTDAKTTIPWYKGTRIAVRKAQSLAGTMPVVSPWRVTTSADSLLGPLPTGLYRRLRSRLVGTGR